MLVLVVMLTFFLILALLVYVSGKSLLSLINHFKTINIKKYWFIYILIQVVLLLSMFSPIRWINLMSSYWMAIMFYFIILSGIMALIKLTPIKKEMHKLLDISKVILSVILVIMAVINANYIRITTYHLEINHEIPDLNIVVFSDIHLGFRIGYERIERIVRKTNELTPDLVIIPGDIFDGSFYHVSDIDKIINELRNINATYGVFATLGNHDMMGYESQIREFLLASNITLLEDDIAEVNGITIIGRNDLTPIIRADDFVRKPLSELMENVDRTKPIFLIDHQPFGIQDAVDYGIDLFIAGHSHNGQVFPGSIITNLLFIVGYGHKQINNTNIVVTSGVSFWGPPIRMGTISEIVRIKLTGSN